MTFDHGARSLRPGDLHCSGQFGINPPGRKSAFRTFGRLQISLEHDDMPHFGETPVVIVHGIATICQPTKRMVDRQSGLAGLGSRLPIGFGDREGPTQW
jgi:hypothetical protein